MSNFQSQHQSKSPGQQAYEAYHKALNGLDFVPWSCLDAKAKGRWADAMSNVTSPGQTLFEGIKPFGGPSWPELDPERQAAYEAAARATSEPVPCAEGGVQTIREWQKVIHEYAQEKGWWDRPRGIGDIFILFAGEVHEAYEEYRNGHEVTEVYFKPEAPDKPEGVPVELADVIIRIMDFAQWAGIDLQDIMETKHNYNLTRSYRHGGKRT